MNFYEDYKQFSRLINYYADKLGDREYYSSFLWSFLWILVKTSKYDLNDRYIAVCIRNEYIRLSKENIEYNPDFDILSNDNWCDIDSSIDISNIMQNLTEKEREIIKFRFFLGYSVAEISFYFGCSRQYMHRVIKKILRKLRKYC